MNNKFSKIIFLINSKYTIFTDILTTESIYRVLIIYIFNFLSSNCFRKMATRYHIFHENYEYYVEKLNLLCRRFINQELNNTGPVT
uniref:Uncharacterized protein n=1 Tax=viral metagenome TaxID=1070528 RepID=A0A6C0AE65_9ZZZZ